MLDLAAIDDLIATIDAPDGWTFMGHDGAFPLEIREVRSFREVVTLTGDPNDMAESIAAMPSALLALRAELAAAQAERDNLHSVAESRLMRMRTASQLLIAEIGAKGPENVDITAGRAVAVIEALRKELTAARRAGGRGSPS